MSDSTSLSTSHIPQLNETNGMQWKRSMVPVLKAKKYYRYITKDTTDPAEAENDQQVQGFIMHHVETNLHSLVATDATAFATWAALCAKFEKVGPQLIANCLWGVTAMRYADGTSLEAHLNRCSDAFAQLDAAGVKLPDVVKSLFILGSLPASWSAFKTTQTAAATTDHLTVSATSRAILAARDLRLLEQHSATSLVDSSTTALAAVQRTPTPQRRRDASCTFCLKSGHEEHECFRKAAGRPRVIRGPHANVASAAPASIQHYSFAVLSPVAPAQGVWFVDSGASNHYCSEAALMHSLIPHTPSDVISANGTRSPLQGTGSVSMVIQSPAAGTSAHVTFTDVGFAPALAVNLLSVGRLQTSGLDVRMPGGGTECVIRRGRHILAVADRVQNSNLYRLRSATPAPPPPPAATRTQPQVCLVADAPTAIPPSTLWHQRLGHANHLAVSNLLRLNMTADVHLVLRASGEHCEPCVLGKHHRTAVPTRTAARRATRPLLRIHLDICGPLDSAYDGSIYLLQIVDDCTRYTWASGMSNREAKTVLGHLQRFVSEAESLHSGHRVSILRSDNGAELMSALVTAWLHERGITRERTTPHNPHQNGVVERMNRVTTELGRTLLLAARLPARFWPLAFDTAIYCRNRCPTSTLDQRTPYEAWYGSKPKIAHLRVFGCLAYTHVRKAERSKLDAKARPCIFVGYSPDSSAYRLWDQQTDKLVESRDVYFVEGQFGIQARGAGESLASSTSLLPPLPPPSTETLVPLSVDDFADTLPPLIPPPADDAPPPLIPPPAADAAVGTIPAAVAPPAAPQRPLSREEKSLLDTLQSGPKYHAPSTLNNLALLARTKVVQPANDSVTGDPTTYAAAIDSPQQHQWREAMDSEMRSLDKAGTYTLVSLPPNRTAIGCKWVVKTKRGADGSITKHKARLVAKGFLQRYGVDYEETYAPVARYASIRAILALTAQHDWELHQMDVKSAYLNGDLEEDIYMTQPQGYQAAGREQLVCKLRKSLYGLKQAGRTWHTKIDVALKRKDFLTLDADECVYVKRQGELTVIIALYVDDLLIACSSIAELGQLKRDLTAQFDTEDLGEASFLLGIDIRRNRAARTISIGQSAYVTSILERHGMSDCTSANTPMQHDNKAALSKPPADFKADDDAIREYQAIIGGVMFAMICTRPDIAFAVNTLAQFTSNPAPCHQQAVKRILQYLRGTMDRRITYTGTDSTCTHPELIGYSDADWGGGAGFRSVTGYAFLLAGGAISWQSKRQKTVALSTVEAEYMATTEAVKEAIWWRSFLSGLGHDMTLPTTLLSDSQGSIALAHNPEHHARTKHIAIRYHFIREHVAKKTIALTFVGTADMAADLFTKALDRVAYERGVHMLGLTESSSRGGVEIAR